MLPQDLLPAHPVSGMGVCLHLRNSSGWGRCVPGAVCFGVYSPGYPRDAGVASVCVCVSGLLGYVCLFLDICVVSGSNLRVHGGFMCLSGVLRSSGCVCVRV